MAERKHSWRGIASFVISIVVGVLMLAVFISAGIYTAKHAERDPADNTSAMIGFGAIVLLIADVVAVVLGVAAVRNPHANRLFGILGLVFSSLILVGTVGLIVLGLVIAKTANR